MCEQVVGSGIHETCDPWSTGSNSESRRFRIVSSYISLENTVRYPRCPAEEALLTETFIRTSKRYVLEFDHR